MIYMLNDVDDLARVLRALQTRFVQDPTLWTSVNEPTFNGKCDLVYRMAESRMDKTAGRIDRQGMRECRLLADVPVDEMDEAVVFHIMKHIEPEYPVLMQLDDPMELPVDWPVQHDLCVRFQSLRQVHPMHADDMGMRRWREYGNRTVDDLRGVLGAGQCDKCVLIEHDGPYRPARAGACRMPPPTRKREELTVEQALKLLDAERQVFVDALADTSQAHTYICTELGVTRSYKAAWNSPSRGVWCTLTTRMKEDGNG